MVFSLLSLQRSDGPDFATLDGSTIVEVKDGQGGVRDLRAAATQLALYARAPQVEHAVLVVRDARMSDAGIREEWQRVLSILLPDIAKKLELVALLGDAPVLLPDTAFLRDLARWAAATPRQSPPRPDRSLASKVRQTQAFVDQLGGVLIRKGC